MPTTLTPPALRLVATGAALPGDRVAGAVLTNERLAALSGDVARRLADLGAPREVEVCSATFPVQRIGVLERRILDHELGVRELAVAAAEDVFANLPDPRGAARRLRVVIVATVSSIAPAPAVATVVAGALGAGPDLQAFDLVVGCSGFLAALETAGALLARHGPGSSALVIGAEAMSRVLDASDRTSAPIFGDAAAAVLVERTGSSAVCEAVDTTTLPGGGPRIRVEPAPPAQGPILRFSSVRGEPVLVQDASSRLVVRMDGRRVFRDMVRTLPGLVAGALERRGLPLDAIDRFVFHQANARLIEAVADGLGIAPERLPMNIARVGNTTSASIPLLLHEASRAGELRPGERVLLVGFGTGYSVGVTSLLWS